MCKGSAPRMSPSTLDQYREKWREAPRGSDTDGRIFSTDLLVLADEPFLGGVGGHGGATERS